MGSPAPLPSPLPDVPRLAVEWTRDGRPAALVTVLETWGSAPRPAGSQLVVRPDEHFEGSVSGGCIEGDVLTLALEIMARGGRTTREYKVSNEEAWDVGLACGGAIAIGIEAVDEELRRRLEELNRRRDDKKQTVLATSAGGGGTALYSPGERLELGGVDFTAAADEALRSDKAGPVEESGVKVFLNPFNPPLRLFVIGAVHIAQALVPMAEIAGFEVTVIDPRGVFASEARMGAAALIEDWPDDVLAAADLDARSAVITLTHDPKLDDAALEAALSSEAFYIGSLGSRKTHKARLGRLEKQGFDKDALVRIHGPLGLEIEARSPAEIAISALAEVIATLRGAAG